MLGDRCQLSYCDLRRFTLMFGRGVYYIGPMVPSRVCVPGSVVLLSATELTYLSSPIICDRIRVIPIEMPSFPKGIWLVFCE